MTPAVHFVLLGALLFALKQLVWSSDAILVSAAQIERLRAEWITQTRRDPTATELDAMVRAWADEELQVREALRRGLDRSDPVVRRRLVQNMRFVHAAGDRSDESLLEEALALGLAQRDLVVRRRLVHAWQERLAGAVKPGDDDVRAYVERHRDRYAAAARVAFRHAFVDAERHRVGLDAAARELGARLTDGERVTGDSFLLGHEFPAATETEIARGFGMEFAAALMRAPDAEWTGPIRSPYGLHYVYVERRGDPGPADFARVSRQAYYALRHERERDAIASALRELRRRYPVEVGS